MIPGTATPMAGGTGYSVLDRILAVKEREVAATRQTADLRDMERRAAQMPPTRDFIKALTGSGPNIIAEIKRCSPSRGEIRPGAKAEDLAALYQANGAAAISILTDRTFFGGSLEDLAKVRRVVDLPLLRKDFITDPVQLLEARLAGADAALLIVAALEPERLARLHALALALDLTPLVEVHNRAELDAALTLEPNLIGINNRDLNTLAVDIETSLKLRAAIPAGIPVIAESGVRSGADISRLAGGGLNAFLIGTSLMRAPDPGEALAGLIREAVPEGAIR